ncbi:nitrate/nitrite transporter [Patulibacter defluvii]|uniref:nitrate/nitrite transporter n=1 Tax=Patulibacter defluvii TaxID=3095358 RepID=UPI002A75B07A|nr:nitrate/nitrite transporter [Patulibacter sp. DM4]
MSVTIDQPTAPAAASPRARGRWIDQWDPDDERFWESSGRRIARRNLAFSIFAEHIGFSIWVLWAVIAINLGNVGIAMSLSELFWLTAIPNLVGSFLRIPYTFAVPRFGGRAWTLFSAALLLIPALLLAIVVPSGWLAEQSHDTQFWVLLACAATAGVGGGNFSSSMANISYFYPEKHKGKALGLNAAGGNLGVAVSQLVVPLVIVIGVPAAAVKAAEHEVHLAYAGLMWIPLIVIAMLGAWFRMDSLSQARSDRRSYVRAARQPHAWIMSVLYIGTFGSFIGYSFALPLVIKNTFPEFLARHPFIATYLAGLGFLGALIGSIARPLGGVLADRIGGAKVTLVCFVGMGACTLLAIVGVQQHSFPLFFGAFCVIFALSGAGNGSTYRMIPAIFATLGRREGDDERTRLSFKRQAAAVIGIAGAVGAFGGFLIQVVFRQASLGTVQEMSAATKAISDKAELAAAKAQIAAQNSDWSIPALWVFLAAYAVMALMTWAFYLRRASATGRVPSLAEASV